MTSKRECTHCGRQSKRRLTKNMCGACYGYFRRNGRLRPLGVDNTKHKTRRPLDERFWAKVDRRGLDDCWLWTGKTAGVPSHQYGMIHSGGKNGRLIQATHVAWFINHGYWTNKYICHHCDNPSCVNPGHLFEGTASDNSKDAYRKGRTKLPRGRPSRLSDKEVREIRSLYRTGHFSQQRIADIFGMSQTMISHIVNYRALYTWKYG